MTESRDTISVTELSSQGKLIKPSHTRGYVPKGNDVEPDQAPTGAAGTSTTVSDEEHTTDPESTLRR